MPNDTEHLEAMDAAFISLHKIDSCIRNGQFVSAYREIHNVLAKIEETPELGIIRTHLNKTLALLQGTVDAYSENQRTMDALKKERRSMLEKMRSNEA